MFTGIIQNLGTIKRIQNLAHQVRLSIQFQTQEKNVQKGESIAVNGVCLTAMRIDSRGFDADLVPETLRVTSLGRLRVGNEVNIERSLHWGDAVGGHLVSGHVDAVGKVVKIDVRGGNWSLLVEAPKTIISKLVRKGSVACDGVSLTVQSLTATHFQVAVIPHTLAVTTLRFLKVGSDLNLEIDHSLDLARASRSVKKSSLLTIKNLKKQGF